MFKKFSALLMLIFFMNFNTAFAQNEKFLDRAIVDRAGLLSSSEINSLTEGVHSIEQKHQIKMGIYFLDSLEGYQIGSVADALVKQNFSNANNGGIVLVVDMETRKWWISTDSKMRTRIPDIYVIANSGVIDNLSAENFFGASVSFVNAVDKNLVFYEQNGTAYDASDEFNSMALMMAIVIAIVCGIGIRGWLIGSMSNVHHEVAATDYLKHDSVKLTTNRDIYLFTNVERRMKPKSSGRGGNGGGHGGGGGGGGSF